MGDRIVRTMFYPSKQLRAYSHEQIRARNEFFKSDCPSFNDEPMYEDLEQEISQSPVLLIRHANSKANNL